MTRVRVALAWIEDTGAAIEAEATSVSAHERLHCDRVVGRRQVS